MLEARSLTKYYGHTAAVRHVSFTVKPGEILGYLGPNGAGKSTTVKMLTGLIEPSEGQIFYRGRSATNATRTTPNAPKTPPTRPHPTASTAGRSCSASVFTCPSCATKASRSELRVFTTSSAHWVHGGVAGKKLLLRSAVKWPKRKMVERLKSGATASRLARSEEGRGG